MSTSAEARMQELRIELPVPAPLAAYEGAIRSGSTVVTSGQLPLNDGALVATGLLGADVDLEAGQEAARHCAFNVLAQVRRLLGDLDQIKSVQKVSIFVASAPGFTDQHLVANAASRVFVDVLGDAGRHARSAIGVAALPLNAAIEVEATFAVRRFGLSHLRRKGR